ncbi:MAG: hypothetical protein OSJ43_02315 [Oscillospiraceae bacterium]|nr:hypothetical protein [Oscillospiraceae bacterium]
MTSVIVNDGEILSASRITLEDCGVYGAFMHTACAADREEALAKYAEMKSELTEFLKRDTAPDKELDFFSRFADKY